MKTMRPRATVRRLFPAAAIGAFAALVLTLAATPGRAQSVKVASAPAPAEHAPAEPDRVQPLADVLARPGASEKSRLSAVAALARLGDRRAVRPLIDALADPSATVRALAAAALGKLGAKSALAPLRQATGDDSEAVRTRAKQAIRAIIKANDLSDESVEASASAEGRAGFGRDARATQNNPDLYVLVKSCNDDSPGRADKKTRATHADLLRAVMTSELAAAPLVTSTATVAKRLSLRPRAVDASVVKMDLRAKGRYLELEAELRLVISDDSGKMLSMLTGGAKVSVPRKGFNWSYLPQLRKDAIESAVRGLFGKLLVHLRSTVAA